MKKCMDGLQTMYPKMIYVTCAAQGLHRIAESIRESFPRVDSFKSEIKKTFVKAPQGQTNFTRETALPLPPEPVITGWGTRLTADEYYADSFQVVKNLLKNWTVILLASVK